MLLPSIINLIPLNSYRSFKALMPHYNYIVKLNEAILIRKVFTTEEEALSKLGLGFGVDRV
jgi:hypothetical protein